VNKYASTYFRLIEKARAEGRSGYAERHHILPRSLGGSDDENNVVRLSAREHFICHLLLTKMTVGSDLRKMQFALACMMMGDGRRYVPSGRIFDIVRQARVEAQTGKRVSDETRKKMSVALKGKPQPESVKVAQRLRRTGVPLSESHRQAVSAGLTGTKRGPYSEEHKEAIRNGLLGLERGAMTEEHKAKISKANSKPKSEATKEKMRLAWEVRRQKIKEPVCV